MVAPAVLAVGGLIIYPLIRGFQQSIQSSGLYGQPKRYVGLAQLSPGHPRSRVDQRDQAHLRVRGPGGVDGAGAGHHHRRHAAPDLPRARHRAGDPGAAVGAAVGRQRSAVAAHLRPRQRLSQQRAAAPARDQRAARVDGKRPLGDRLHHPRARVGRAAAGQPDPDRRAAEHPRGGLQRLVGRRRQPVAAVSLHHLPAAAPLDRGGAHDRHAAGDRDLRRDLRAQRHRAQHPLDPDPGVQHHLRGGRLRPRHGACVPARGSDGAVRMPVRARACGRRRHERDAGSPRASLDRDPGDHRVVDRPDRARGDDQRLQPDRCARGADRVGAALGLGGRLSPAARGHRHPAVGRHRDRGRRVRPGDEDQRHSGACPPRWSP